MAVKNDPFVQDLGLLSNDGNEPPPKYSEQANLPHESFQSSTKKVLDDSLQPSRAITYNYTHYSIQLSQRIRPEEGSKHEPELIVPSSSRIKDHYIEFLQYLKSESVFEEIDVLNESSSDDAVVTLGRKSDAALRSQMEKIAKPATGTCKWIFEQPEYAKWLISSERRENVLVVQSKPAFGKSVLAKHVFSSFENSPAENDRLRPLAFFCAREIANRSSAHSIIASFLFQILCENKSLRELLPQRVLSEKLGRMETQDLYKIFADLASSPYASHYVYLIDALDECDNASQQELQRALFHPENSLRFRLMITTRPGIYGDLLSKRFVVLDVSAEMVSKDIITLLTQEFDMGGITDRYEQDMVETLRQAINAGAQGMFLVVKIRIQKFNSLKDNPAAGLSGFSGPEEWKSFFRAGVLLKDFYNQMLDHIPDLEVSRQKAAVKMLNIALASQNALSLKEFDAAFTFSTDQINDYTTYLEAMKYRDLFDDAFILCKHLIEIHGKSSPDGERTLSIVHPSAADYLELDRDSDSEDVLEKFLSQVSAHNGHVLLATACLRYMIVVITTDFDHTYFRRYPFLLYALCYWDRHVRESKASAREYGDLLLKFLDPACAAYLAWNVFQKWVKNSFEPLQEAVTPFSAIETIISQRLDNVFDDVHLNGERQHVMLYDHSIDVNVPAVTGHSLLVETILMGRPDYARKLLSLGFKDVLDTTDHMSAVLAALFSGSDDMILDLVKANGLENSDRQYADLIITIQLASQKLEATAWRRLFLLLISLGYDVHHRRHGWTILHEAAMTATFHVIKTVFGVANQSDINSTDEGGLTPLLVAVDAGASLDIIKYLVTEQRADPNIANTDGANALHAASRKGDAQIVQFLLPYMSNLNATWLSWTALHFAASRNHLEVVRLLVLAGANMTIKDTEGDTALMISVSADNVEVATLLCESGADVNETNQDDESVLYVACKSSPGLVASVLRAGADPFFKKSVTGISCLHIAAYNGDEAIVRLLIEQRGQGRDVNEIEQSSGWTPLMAAATYGHVGVAMILLDASARLDIVSASHRTILHMVVAWACDNKLFDRVVAEIPRELLFAETSTQDTALHLAARSGFAYAVEVLLKLKFCSTSFNKDRCTPLYLAVCSGSTASIQALLKANNLPNARASSGFTALHAASQTCEDVSTLQCLFDQTNWLFRSRSIGTPLTIAADHGNENALRIFLEGGMDPSFMANSGSSALHFALSQGYDHLAELLISRGANLDGVNSSGQPPYALLCNVSNLATATRPTSHVRLYKNNFNLRTLAYVAVSISDEELQYMLQQNIDPTSRDCMNSTVLDLCVNYNRIQSCRNLLNDYNTKDCLENLTLFSGQTPAHGAARACMLDIVELLIEQGRQFMHVKDYLGLTPTDYLTFHINGTERERILALMEASGGDCESTTAADEIRHKSSSKQQFLFWQTSAVLACLLHDSDHTFKDEFCVIDKVIFMNMLTQMLNFLDDEEELMTVLHQRLTLYKHRRYYADCDLCHKDMRMPLMQSGSVQNRLYFCRVCPLRYACETCRHDTETNSILGCHKHSFLEYPSEDWFNWSDEKVNNKGQTEREWLTSLAEKYAKLQEKEFDVSVLPKFSNLYLLDRASIFELCSSIDLVNVVEHLRKYPRDIALKNVDGETLVFKIIRLAKKTQKAKQLSKY